MSFDQTAVPESCPGTSSSTAGSAAGCQGCPNQAVCSASAASGQDPRALAAAESRDIARRLQSVAYKLVVLSGKGGVGKSTFSTTLARGLASLKVDDGSDEYCHVGLLDVDICGPSIPLMMGVEGEDVHNSSQGWSPVFVEEDAPSSSSSSSSSSPSSSSSLSAKLVDDETIEKPLHDDEGDDEASKPDHLGTIAVMSVGFLLESEDQAVIWRGPKKNGLIKQFLRDVDWGPLDYLVIDTPPGTSDEHLSLVSYLKAAKITGAVVVTTPQELSLLDVRKEINFCRKVGIPIIGVVENMSAFVCPKCSHQSLIFPPTTGGAAAMAAEMSIPFLGSIPIDPRLARACDEGQSFLALYPDSPAALSYHQIIQKIVQYTQSQTKK